MNDFRVNVEYSPSRCEICHQSDLFDPQTDRCSRCENVEMGEAQAFDRTKRRIDYGNVGLIAGAIAGGLIGIIGETVSGLSLAQLSAYPVIIGLAMVGAIWGTICGEGMRRLRKPNSNSHGRCRLKHL